MHRRKGRVGKNIGPEPAKRHVRHAKAQKHPEKNDNLTVILISIKSLGVDNRQAQKKCTDQRPIRQFIHKLIENLGDRMHAQLRPPDPIRILIHAPLPSITHRLHRRHPLAPVAPILHILARTQGHIGQRGGNGFLGLVVDVLVEVQEEAGDGVDDAKTDDGVDDELDPVGEDGRDVGMFLDQAEEGGDVAHLDSRCGGSGAVVVSVSRAAV